MSGLPSSFVPTISRPIHRPSDRLKIVPSRSARFRLRIFLSPATLSLLLPSVGITSIGTPLLGVLLVVPLPLARLAAEPLAPPAQKVAATDRTGPGGQLQPALDGDDALVHRHAPAIK